MSNPSMYQLRKDKCDRSNTNRVSDSNYNSYDDGRRNRNRDNYSSYSSRGRERGTDGGNTQGYNEEYPSSRPDRKRPFEQSSYNHGPRGDQRGYIDNKQNNYSNYSNYSNRGGYQNSNDRSTGYQHNDRGYSYQNSDKGRYNRPQNSWGQQRYARGPSSSGSNQMSLGNSNGHDRYRPPTYPDNQQPQEEPQKPEDPAVLKKSLEMYEEKLKEMTDKQSLEDITGIDSKWGKKPSGFENVSSQRAKLSGLFPLPGHPRPIDFTKLEGIVRNRTLNGNDILIDTSRIDPNDSIAAKTVFITGIDFDQIDYLKVAQAVNKYLAQLDVPEVQDDNIEFKTRTKDNRSLIIEFRNNLCATICLTLDEKSVEVDGTLIPITITRPNEYIAQGYVAKEDDSNVPDCAYKVALHFGTEHEEDEVRKSIEEHIPIKQFQFLKEKYNKESMGIAFANFQLQSYDPTSAITVVQQVLLNLTQGSSIFSKADFACIVPNQTSIQEQPSNMASLQSFVKNQLISTTVTDNNPNIVSEVVRDNRKSKVIQIINAVTTKDLKDDETYGFISSDVEQEVKKFGEVIRVKIPRPANDFTPGLTESSTPGLGRIFVEFSNEDSAFKAILGLAGRMYNDRTVLCSYFDVDDFNKTIMLSK
ncbi:hypothetical protein PSN45_003001 [Yamadazyma tenuis]|uniref:RRM domain-containing protein n=1 Tax=Candida tenuis (strain ATCC 10573 / BCRC 21748 / CBS 615 / JCM 9827 / NBRC 10315 / NRRL Y-1498 / VKM Y-70) TaxID=590646 RepID=G3AXK3_CANTC|nr:uncharacterized protein CANTEDRAFT_91566 [Yamadazyma tenuis ATCC 10573]EGV66405.1 hypothetical protein CANTEDRAFT_91566 [Yamadazyma tenuis ATCC 10573]WEJ95481.1 hypothetical protein PSN45_003001 [Yamadazyma tenuis]